LRVAFERHGQEYKEQRERERGAVSGGKRPECSAVRTPRSPLRMLMVVVKRFALPRLQGRGRRARRPGAGEGQGATGSKRFTLGGGGRSGVRAFGRRVLGKNEWLRLSEQNKK